MSLRNCLRWEILLAVGALIWSQAFANPTMMPVAALIRANSKLKLSFTSAALAGLENGLCSSAVTVQANSASGAAVNVSSDVTVNLTSTGTMSFYADPDCSIPTSSTTIYNGTSTSDFYVLDPHVESPVITVSATHFSSATQTEGMASNPFVWIGGGSCNQVWATGLCWQSGSAPGAGQIAVFDGTCTSNCNPSINSAVSVAGIRMNNGYSNSNVITQNAGGSINLSGSFVQQSGTFLGNTSASLGNPGNGAGLIAITGGVFTAPGTIYAQNLNVSIPSGNFTAGIGTINFPNPSPSYITINPGSVVYNNVNLNTSQNITLTGTWNISSSFSIANSGGTPTMDGGTINETGSGVMCSGAGFTGSTVVVIAGSASPVVNFSGGCVLPNLNINSTASNIIFSGNIQTGNYTYTNGTINVGTSTLTIAGTSAVFGSPAYNNVTFAGGTVAMGSALTASSVLVNSGNVQMSGNALTTNALNLSGHTMNKGGGVLTVATVVQGLGSIDGGVVAP